MLRDEDIVTISHGSGGAAMRELINQVFLAGYGRHSDRLDDSAVLTFFPRAGSDPCTVSKNEVNDIAFTTDSYVIDPIFFPGGDIGKLAVSGTVNDLLAIAAKPLAISASFIIEEGFTIGDLRTIADSMKQAANEAGVSIVTGDTKVVPPGKADKLFITTSGMGLVLKPGVSGTNAKPGDSIIVSGTVGDHGAAVMLARERLLEAPEIRSDTAPLTDLVLRLLDAGIDIHTMRDPTRGGIAAALNEIASQSQVHIEIEESEVPIAAAVNAVCEALGIDPFCVANEGKMLIFVGHKDAQKALDIVRSCSYGESARVIGTVTAAPPGRVTLRTSIGSSRILWPPTGALLPRIC